MFCVLLAACNAQKKEKSVTERIDPFAITEGEENLEIKQNEFPEIKSETNLDKLIVIIAKQNVVNEKFVGIAGTYTDVYAAFERMNEIASSDELFRLLDHASGAVRVYAYKCLQTREAGLSENAKVILEKSDMEVDWFSGCIRSVVPIQQFLEEK